ncbi:MAG: HAD family hydrolase [Thermoleophilaceae bacterium]
MSDARPIRAVISDFGGVLTSPLFESFAAWQRTSGLSFERLGQAMADAAERSGIHPLYELEKGTITEAELLGMLEAELDPGTNLSEMRDVYFEHLHPNPPMIEVMRELRGRGLRMALLTNNVREWEPHWRAKLPEIDEIFEVVVDSAFVGMRKPDPDIYALTLERLGDGLEPADCLFVDDVDVNCETAASLGMRVVHYREAAQAIEEIRAQIGGEAPVTRGRKPSERTKGGHGSPPK